MKREDFDTLFQSWVSFARANSQIPDNVMGNMQLSFIFEHPEQLEKRQAQYQERSTNWETQGDYGRYRTYTCLAWLYYLAAEMKREGTFFIEPTNGNGSRDTKDLSCNTFST